MSGSIINYGVKEKQGLLSELSIQKFILNLEAGGKRKGKRTRKPKADKSELFASLEFKIGIEREDFDKNYDEFMKMCPKVKIKASH